jgi:hypothetical protein
MGFRLLSCRTGPLRVGRSLRDVYTGFAPVLPMVGTRIFLIATNGSANRRGTHFTK